MGLSGGMRPSLPQPASSRAEPYQPTLHRWHARQARMASPVAGSKNSSRSGSTAKLTRSPVAT
jgi:hypothetical protein